MIPMQLGAQAEIEVLVYSLTAGVFMGVVYDFFRVIRRLFAGRTVTFICDLIFMVIFSAGYFTVSLAQTDYLRGFVLAGMIAGAAMWCYTIGRAAVWLVTLILGFFIKQLLSPMFVLVNKICKQSYFKTVGNAINLQKAKKIPQST